MAIQEISLAITSIRTALDIARGINSLNIDVAVKEKASELYDAIISIQNGMLSLQSKYQELLETNNNLSAQLMQFENWEKTQSQYQLMKTSVGTFIMTPNASHPSPQPLHWLCANCFDNKQKSILQKTHWQSGSPMICPKCKTIVHLGDREEQLIR